MTESTPLVEASSPQKPLMRGFTVTSNLSLLARSESGEADCNLPELKPAPDTCEGTMKTGRGLLIIHTLGGPISVTQ